MQAVILQQQSGHLLWSARMAKEGPVLRFIQPLVARFEASSACQSVIFLWSFFFPASFLSYLALARKFRCISVIQIPLKHNFLAHLQHEARARPESDAVQRFDGVPKTCPMDGVSTRQESYVCV